MEGEEECLPLLLNAIKKDAAGEPVEPGPDCTGQPRQPHGAWVEILWCDVMLCALFCHK